MGGSPERRLVVKHTFLEVIEKPASRSRAFTDSAIGSSKGLLDEEDADTPPRGCVEQVADPQPEAATPPVDAAPPPPQVHRATWPMAPQASTTLDPGATSRERPRTRVAVDLDAAVGSLLPPREAAAGSTAAAVREAPRASAALPPPSPPAAAGYPPAWGSPMHLWMAAQAAAALAGHQQTAVAGACEPARQAAAGPGPPQAAAQAQNTSAPRIASSPLGAQDGASGRLPRQGRLAGPAEGAEVMPPWPSDPLARVSAPTDAGAGPSHGALTTVMLRNLPNRYTRSMLVNMLDDEGFAGRYDFVYLPIDFKTHAGLGYAFVDLTNPADADRLRTHFEGFSRWCLQSDKVCTVSWSHPEQQGLSAHVKRYRNSPVMHGSVSDDWKPALFQDGQRVPFPPPTRKLRAPHVRPQPRGDV